MPCMLMVAIILAVTTHHRSLHNVRHHCKPACMAVGHMGCLSHTYRALVWCHSSVNPNRPPWAKCHRMSEPYLVPTAALVWCHSSVNQYWPPPCRHTWSDAMMLCCASTWSTLPAGHCSRPFLEGHAGWAHPASHAREPSTPAGDPARSLRRYRISLTSNGGLRRCMGLLLGQFRWPQMVECWWLCGGCASGLYLGMCLGVPWCGRGVPQPRARGATPRANRHRAGATAGGARAGV